MSNAGARLTAVMARFRSDGFRVTRHLCTVVELIYNTKAFSPPPLPAAEKFLAVMPDEE